MDTFRFQSRRTSPVTVPISSISRQRNESTSSVGSWQMVNQSGSLRSTDSTNLFQSLRSQNSNSQESNTTLVDDDIFTYNQNAVIMYLLYFLFLHTLRKNLSVYTIYSLLSWFDLIRIDLVVPFVFLFCLFHCFFLISLFEYFFSCVGVAETVCSQYEVRSINVIVKRLVSSTKMELKWHLWEVCWVILRSEWVFHLNELQCRARELERVKTAAAAPLPTAKTTTKYDRDSKKLADARFAFNSNVSIKTMCSYFHCFCRQFCPIKCTADTWFFFLQTNLST